MRFRTARRTNSSLFFFLFGFIFAAAGICAGAFFGQTNTLNCRRVESSVVNCRLQSDLLGYPISDREIGAVQSAWVDVSSDSEGDTYRVVLQGAEGEAPLTSYYSSARRNREETATAINAYLADPTQETLQIEQAERWIFLLTGVFVAIGFLSIGFGMLQGFFNILRRLSIGRAV